ncbi:MFS transporter [Bacillus velezensis]|nr:MFS transporter [Bacillus velezensis]
MLIVLALGFLMATLDVTVVNVAMADMKNTLSMSLSGVTWVVDGYILTFASLLLAGGALADRFGSKAIYILGLAVFVMASCLCAVSINGQMLIAGRLMQGIGAALFMPSSLSLLAASYPDERVRARMFGLWAALVSSASGLGPFIGGVLVQAAGWQSIFLINVPLGFFALISAYRVLGHVPQRPHEHYRASAWNGRSRLSFVCLDTGAFSGLALTHNSWCIRGGAFGICAVFAAGNLCGNVDSAGVLISKRPILNCSIRWVFAEFCSFRRHVYAKPFCRKQEAQAPLWPVLSHADDGGLRDGQYSVCPSGESV